MESLELLRKTCLANPGIDVLAELRKVCRPPGIYFGLDAEPYHADPSIGGTAIVDLRDDLRGWQLGSWMVPPHARITDEDTQATVVGTALHKMVLEGMNAFGAIYMRRPPDAPDASQGDKSTLTKAFKKTLGPGQIMLRADEYSLCVNAAARITEHEALRKSLEGGQNEVSVFWIDQQSGIPCKARFDRLKAAGVGDIKTIANQYGRRLDTACKYAIKNQRYDLQAAHYLIARSVMPRLIKEGRVNTTDRATPEQLRAQEQLVTEIVKTRAYAFQFIFIQKSKAAVWSQNLSPENPLIVNATEDRASALAQLAKMYADYGVDHWPETWVLGELHPDDMPGGDWGWD